MMHVQFIVIDETTCSGNGSCQDDGTCLCNGNFTGINCNKCNKNYYGSTCAIYCSDEQQTCGDHGVCNSLGGCTCDSREELFLRNVNFIKPLNGTDNTTYEIQIDNIIDNTESNWILFKRLVENTNNFIILSLNLTSNSSVEETNKNIEITEISNYSEKTITIKTDLSSYDLTNLSIKTEISGVWKDDEDGNKCNVCQDNYYPSSNDGEFQACTNFCSDTDKTCGNNGVCNTDNGLCVCNRTDDLGYWDGTFVVIVSKDYYGEDCKTECNQSTCGIGSFCNQDDGSCICFENADDGYWQKDSLVQKCTICKDNYYPNENVIGKCV